MLVDNDVYVNRYVADGSTASFPIAFPFLEASHIEVYTRGEDGEDILVDPSMYTITGAGIEEGGELTFNTVPVAGTVIAIVRNVPITQLYAYTELDNFPAESHENALAKLTMIDQQQAEILGRAVLVPVTSDKTPEQLTAEIFQARDDASGYASDAAAYASSANDILSDVISTGSAYVDQITSDGSSFLTQISSGGSAQIADIASSGNSYLNLISSGGSAALTSIGNAQTSALNTISSGGSAVLTSIGNAKTSALNAITSGGSAQVAAVTSEGNTQAARLEQYASGVIQNATSLYTVATTTLSSNISSGTTITTPLVNGAALSYWVGKDMLGMSYNGVELYKGLQYEEVGSAGTTSYKVKTLMPMYAGDQLCFKAMAAIVDSIVADPLQPDGTSIQIDGNGKLSVVLTDQAITQAIGYTAADDSAVVKLSDNQIISGVKTFTDYIAFQNTGIINVQKRDNSSVLSLYGGGNYQKGAYATLKGIGQASDPGSFSITATDGGSNVKAFLGKPDGTLTWGGKDIITNGGNQTIGGEKKFTTNVTIENGGNPALIINRSSGGTGSFTDLQYQIAGNIKAHVRKTDEYLRIGSVSTAAPTSIFTGPNLVLYEAGNFRLVARNNNTERILEGKDNGTLTWLGNTIQTSSDERLKTAFSAVPDAVLDAWGKVNWQQFKFRDAVAEKGEENCRWHPGLVAQRVKAVFEAEGLDACTYGILCHEEWQDEYAEDENGERILQRPAGDVWMVRYEEALAMEAAYQRRRADRAEARLADIERRLTILEGED